MVNADEVMRYLFKFSIDSVDNYVIFACCARGVTLSKLMLHSLAIVLIIINQSDSS